MTNDPKAKATADAPAAAPAAAPTLQEEIMSLYEQWRNTHLNNIAPAAFEALENAAKHLIADVEALFKKKTS